MRPKRERKVEKSANNKARKIKFAFENPNGFVSAYYLFDAEGKLMQDESFAANEPGFDLLKNSLDQILIVAA